MLLLSRALVVGNFLHKWCSLAGPFTKVSIQKPSGASAGFQGPDHALAPSLSTTGHAMRKFGCCECSPRASFQNPVLACRTLLIESSRIYCLKMYFLLHVVYSALVHWYRWSLNQELPGQIV